MLYKFQLDYYAVVKASKDVFCEKGEVLVDHRTVTKGLKKFCLGCKILNDQAKAGRQAILKMWILMSCSKSLWQIQWVALGEYQASSASNIPVWFITSTKLRILPPLSEKNRHQQSPDSVFLWRRSFYCKRDDSTETMKHIHIYKQRETRKIEKKKSFLFILIT